MNIIKIILGTIYLLLSMLLAYMTTKDKKNKALYIVFDFIVILTSAILIFGL